MPVRKRRGPDLARFDQKTLLRAHAAAIGVVVFLRPSSAFAMHLAEGILPLGWAGAWWVAAIPVLGTAAARLSRRSEASPLYKPFVAMIAATVFGLSGMPVPVPVVGSCSPPCGTGVTAGILR